MSMHTKKKKKEQWLEALKHTHEQNNNKKTQLFHILFFYAWSYLYMTNKTCLLKGDLYEKIKGITV